MIKKQDIQLVLPALLIISIWAFNEDKIITYPIKIIFILYYGYRWLMQSRGIASKYQFWCIIMMMFTLVAFVFAGGGSRALYTMINMFQVLLIGYCLMPLISDGKLNEDFLITCIIAGGCILGIRLVLTTPISTWLSFERLGASIGYSSNDIGNKAAVSAIFSICFMKESHGKRKLKYLAVFIFLGIIVLFSGSRKALLSVLIAGVLFYTIGLKNKRNFFISIVLITVACFGIYHLIMNNSALYWTVGRRIESMIGAVFYGQSEASSIDLREKYMMLAWELFKKSPIAGIGLDQFAIKSGIGVYCHCDYLEVMCGYGIVGAVIYYLPFLGTLFKLVSIDIKSTRDYTFIILIMVLLFNFFTMIMYTSAYTQILLVLSITHCHRYFYRLEIGEY